MDPEEVLLDAEERMEKAVSVFKDQLNGLRTGRATPGLVDQIRVEQYGQPTPLKNMANISCPEPQQIVIRPFDQGMLSEIAKAIQSSDAGLAPNSDGRIIRLNIPPLSTERRKEMVTRGKSFAEDSRVSIRNIRRDANKHLETGQKDGDISEDQLNDYKDQVQELTKKYEGRVNDAASAKEKEIMDE